MEVGDDNDDLIGNGVSLATATVVVMPELLRSLERLLLERSSLKRLAEAIDTDVDRAGCGDSFICQW